jgi:glycosyltransferase involved in cell wall biosynthesis
VTDRRRVLVVSYHFPPVGGAGVQRIAKFARYLPEFGWDVSVLQAANPSAPLRDESLLAELPADLLIERARTFEPSYAAKAPAAGSGANGTAGGVMAALRRGARQAARTVLQPDAQILWFADAVRHGVRLLRRVPHHAILATAPAYTNLLVGRRLAHRSGLPLVCDFRDEWDLSQAYWENASQTGAALAVQRRMQRAVLRCTEAIVATTEASTRRLAARAVEAGAHPRALCIYNGWDAADFARARAVAPPVPRSREKFRLAYTGTLWNLTSVAPLAEAVERVAAATPALAGRLELLAIGRKTAQQRTHLARIAEVGASLVELPYAEHTAVLATLQSADALLLLLSNLPGVERVVPAKLFEYLAAERPILAILPEGEAATLVRAAQPAAHLLPSDVGGIATWLARRLADAPGRQTASVQANGIARFERRALAGQLAGLLDDMATAGAA